MDTSQVYLRQHAIDNGEHDFHSEGDATRSLLEIDDEYTTPIVQRGAPGGGVFRHYTREAESAERRRPKPKRQGDGLALVSPAQPDHGAAAKAADDELSDTVLKSDDDDTGWRVDFEEEETRVKLEKAMRDQQRLRLEELYELQKVYTKAVRKNFRSLRGMPEPSFDTPSALYEEELDAIEEHRMSAIAQDDSMTASASQLHPPSAAPAHPLQSPRSLESLGLHRSAQEVGVHASTHADCVDERSVAGASTDAIQRVHGADAHFALGGGTHIHTTHGGGTTGDGGVLVGSSNFVSRLRRKTTTDCDKGKYESFRTECVSYDDE